MHFVEQIIGVNPDDGSGLTEILLLGAGIVAVLLLIVRQVNKTRQVDPSES
jgi:hypothetical protein